MNTDPLPRTLRFFTVVRMHRDTRGRLRSLTPLMSTEEWMPFLNVFGNVEIFARLEAGDPDDSGYLLEHPRIEVHALPFYSGAASYAHRAPEIRKFLKRNTGDPSVVYGVWGPGPVPAMVGKLVRRFDGQLIVRLIGDTEDVARAILPWPIGTVVGRAARWQARNLVQRASAVIYVTLRTLQAKYPPRPEVPTLARTNLKLDPAVFHHRRSDYRDFLGGGRVSIIAVGSQQKNYKGHDLLIDAVANLVQRRGHHVDLTIVGQGALHNELVARAADRGIAVNFIRRAGTTVDVAALVAQHDMFIMPSRTEGMPKSLLEAMAVGVFALGSSVGGIPEVLEPEQLFDSGSSRAISDRISYYLKHRELVPEAVAVQRAAFRNIWENHSGPDMIEKFLTEWMEGRDGRD